MYTIYYIFLAVIVISFVTGVILNIVEDKHKKEKLNDKSLSKKDAEVLDNVFPVVEDNNEAVNYDDDKFSQTISFSTPVIISSTVVGSTGMSSSNISNNSVLLSNPKI